MRAPTLDHCSVSRVIVKLCLQHDTVAGQLATADTCYCCCRCRWKHARKSLVSCCHSWWSSSSAGPPGRTPIRGRSLPYRDGLRSGGEVCLVVVVFVVCWLPRHVWYFWYNFDPAEYNMFWHVFKILAYCLSFVNSCVNPLALYFLSRQFRRYYDRYLFCGCRRQAGAEVRGPALLASTAQRGQRAPVDSMATSRHHERLQMTVVDVDARRQKQHQMGQDQYPREISRGHAGRGYAGRCSLLGICSRRRTSIHAPR